MGKKYKFHFVGIGVCGLPIVQVLIDEKNDTWRLCKVEHGHAVEFGNKNKEKIYPISFKI